MKNVFNGGKRRRGMWRWKKKNGGREKKERSWRKKKVKEYVGPTNGIWTGVKIH